MVRKCNFTVTMDPIITDPVRQIRKRIDDLWEEYGRVQNVDTISVTEKNDTLKRINQLIVENVFAERLLIKANQLKSQQVPED